MKRLVYVIGVLYISSIIVGCSGGNDNSGSQAQAQDVAVQTSAQAIPPTLDPSVTSQPALPLTDDGVQMVAKINGQPVTLEEFDRAFTRSQALANTASYDALAASVLNTLIEQELINQAAQSMSIAVSDDEVEAEFRRNRELIPDDASWQEWLNVNGFTEAELRQSFYENLLTLRVIQQVTQQNDTVPTVHARHILVETEEEANGVLARLNAGEDFATIAAEVSIDRTTSTNGGDLDFFTVEDLTFTPELAELAFSLQPNEIAGPVQTMLGFHIIQTLEFSQRSAAPDEQASVVNDQFLTWLQAQRDAATIEQYIEF